MRIIYDNKDSKLSSLKCLSIGLLDHNFRNNIDITRGLGGVWSELLPMCFDFVCMMFSYHDAWSLYTDTPKYRCT